MLYLGETGISKLYLGETPIAKAYLGENLVWSATQPLPYDAEVKYLESTGTQWIDLGTTFSSDAGLEIQAAFTAKTTDIYPVLVGGLSDIDWLGDYFALYEDSGYVTLEDTEAGAEVSADDIDGADFVAQMNYNNSGIFMLAVDGYSPTQSSGHAVTVSSNICLFGATLPNNNVVNLTQAKVYAAKITKGTSVVRDLIPVRKDGVGYMYDRVSGQLLGNSGTGYLTIGPDKH